MGNLTYCSNIFRFKKCSNRYFTKKTFSVNDLNNDELFRELSAKTNLTRDEIEEWHDNFLVSFDFIQLIFSIFF